MGTTAAGRLAPMQARSALFDVYGDHLRARGSQAPVAGRGPAARPGRDRGARRSAPRSRGWSCRAGSSRSSCAGGRGYRATERADPPARRRRRPRLPRGTAAPWDGRWHLAFVDPPRDPRRPHPAARRPGLRRATPSSPTTCGSARFPRAELDSMLERAGATARTARADRFDPEPTGAWDLDAACARRTTAWLAAADDLVAAAPRRRTTTRTRRRSPRASTSSTSGASSSSPTRACPTSLLPADWPGRGPRPSCSPREATPAQARRRPVRRPRCLTGA